MGLEHSVVQGEKWPFGTESLVGWCCGECALFEH